MSLRNKSGSVTGQASLPRSKVLNIPNETQVPLEIKSIMREDQNDTPLGQYASSITSNNNPSNDILPKNLAKPMNDKKTVVYNNTASSTLASSYYSANSLNSLIQISDLSAKRNNKYVRSIPGQNVISSSLSTNNKNNSSTIPLSKAHHGYSSSSLASNEPRTDDCPPVISLNIPSTTPSLHLNSNTKAQIDKVARSTLNRQKVLK